MSPQILKVNKESTLYLHRKIFISRIQLFTLHGESRNLQLLVRWNGVNSKGLPLEFHDCHIPSTLSSPKILAPVNVPPTHSLDTFPQMHLLALFYPEPCHVPFQIPEPLQPHCIKTQMMLHSLNSGVTPWLHMHSWLFYLLKSLQRRPRLKSLQIFFHFLLLFCWIFFLFF